MRRRAVLICLDGCSPDYLRRSNVPNIQMLGKEGFSTESGLAMVPTVTNVNNVSLITGVYPEKHGITSNCYYDRMMGVEVYMESPDSIMVPTIFEELARKGRTSALLSVKDKLCALLNRGPQIVLSAENPPPWIVREIGQPPSIFSIDVNPWLFKALGVVLDRCSPDFIYLGTTDYVGHRYAPDESEARRHMALVDEQIGLLLGRLDGNLLCICADHGMLEKTRAVNLRLALEMIGTSSAVIPTVKDKYVVHHRNLSGSAYVYLAGENGPSQEILDILREIEGVEKAMTAEEASREYRLPTNRIGDYLVLGKEDTVFGETEDVVSEVRIRSHGSLHEKLVPLIAYGDDVESKGLSENKDLTKIVLDYLGQE